MRSYPRLLLLVVASLVAFRPVASAVTMDWTVVGNPGNAPDFIYGAVGYAYSIGTYEITNAQYVEFLNAKAKSDPLGLYNFFMADTFEFQGGITRTNTSGNYTYTAITGRENMPVNLVSFYDALRFANWIQNGQGNGDTETGAYTLLGGTATPTNGTTVTRNAGATIVLPTQDEWFKAAYYNALTTSYFDFPAGSDTQTTCAAPTATPNRANCGGIVHDPTIVGSYTGSPSPYGTFDQGGNVDEWYETIIVGVTRAFGGGAFDYNVGHLAASARGNENPYTEVSNIGFRLAMIPEPDTVLLILVGLLWLSGLAQGVRPNSSRLSTRRGRDHRRVAARRPGLPRAA